MADNTLAEEIKRRKSALLKIGFGCSRSRLRSCSINVRAFSEAKMLQNHVARKYGGMGYQRVLIGCGFVTASNFSWRCRLPMNPCTSRLSWFFSETRTISSAGRS
jgi:hypothetical protein